MVTQGLKAVDELLFGTIAVREGYVSPTQVDECVKLQAERQGSTSSNTKLGLILVERAYMSNDQVAAILDIQKRHLKIIDADPHRGGLFGQLCLDNAFINEEKLQLCLKEQESLAKRGQPAMIGQIMLRRSIISTDQFLQVLKLQRRRVMRCPGCDTFYNIEDQPEGAKFICRRCGTIVAVQSPDRARAAGSPDTVARLTLQEKQDIGAQCGRYVIIEEIGRGGMGIVYKALHRDLNQVFALKVLKESDLAGPEMVQRFKVEAQAAARLKHPNIVAIHDAGEEAGIHYIAMDYIDGQSLAYKMAQRPKIRDMVATLEKVARGVHHAHEHNIVHRDLKPGNVMLDKLGEPHIMDFGLAKFMDHKLKLTREGSFLGTPYYMSPEQVRGDGTAVDHQADIYAMGIILFETLSGRPPHVGANSVEIFNKILNEEPPDPRQLNPKIHPDLTTICLKAIEKDKALRYKSAGDLADDLKRYIDGEPIQARPMGFVARSFKRARKNPAATTAAFSLFMLALTGTILFVSFIRNRNEFENQLTSGREAYAIGQYEGARVHLEAAKRLRPLDADVAALITLVGVKVQELDNRRKEEDERRRRLDEATPRILEAQALLDDLQLRIVADALDIDAIAKSCIRIETTLAEAQSIAPHAAGPYFGLAQSQALRGDIDGAIQNLTLALGKASDHPEALHARARLRLRKTLSLHDAADRPAGFPEAPAAAESRRQAIEDFQRLARLTRSPAQTEFAKTALACLRGEDARALLDDYLALYGSDVDALRLRASLADLKRALRLLPTDVGLHLRLAALQEPAEAEQTLAAATRAVPGDPAGWCALARIRHADAAYLAAIQQAPTSALGFLGLGRLRVAGGDFEGALVPLTRAAQLAPEDPLVFHERARALLGLGRAAESSDDAEAVVRLLPDLSAGFELRGRVEFARARWDAAIADWERAISLDPASKDRLAALVEEARKKRT